MDRRDFIRGVLAAGTVTAAAANAKPIRNREPAPDAVGMLYDSTLCTGCKACVVACRKENGFEPETKDGLHDMQTELNGNTKNVIKLYQEPNDKSVFAYVKQQCMHCVDPACVSVCMLGALQKDKGGIVTYNADQCIGCRYCQVACPFGVPKFQWSSATPKIVKCEMCKDRVATGRQPACTEVCPRNAVIFGKLEDLRAEAHKRIKVKPDKYQPKVYGDEDAGGTQVLYLSAVPFEKLGLPKLSTQSVPYFGEKLQHTLYQGFIAPAALYAGLAAVVVRNFRKGLAKVESGDDADSKKPPAGDDSEEGRS